MSDEMKKLVEEIQREFLSDPDDHLEAMGRAAEDFLESPAESLLEILRQCHNLKGAAQAAGLKNVSEMFHGIESACQSLLEFVNQLSITTTRDAAGFIRQMIGDAKTYFEVLRSLSASASDPFANQWRSSVQRLIDLTEIIGRTLPDHPEIAVRLPAKPVEESPGWGLFDDAPAEGEAKPAPEKPDSSSISLTTAQNVASSSNDWGMGSGAVETPVALVSIAGNASHAMTPAAAVPANQGWGIFEDTPEPQPPLQADKSKENHAPSATLSEAAKPTNVSSFGKPSTELSKQVAPRKIQANQSESGSAQFLLFSRHKQIYAMPVGEVKEVVAARPIKPLPMPRLGFVGVVTISGHVLPLVDPTVTLGGVNAESEPNACMIICIDQDESTFALKVDRVSHVATIELTQLKAVGSDTSLGLRRGCVQAIGEIDGETIFFIQTKGLLGERSAS